MNAASTSSGAIRRAERGDAERIAVIFNQGIEDRVATFETKPATPEDAVAWVERDIVVVAENDGGILGWAKAGPYADQHHYYDGVREATLYVARSARRRGIGRHLLAGLADAASDAGAHKLIGKIFTSNEPSIALVKGLGWREVGVHLRHGTLDGEWKDVLVVEKLLGSGG
ncbi:MAG TPA: arsinothricin resistance N-acetyltransferase ArsN1 family A [Solirubrobacterales bacterium]|jgi:phosphinothricin acetyltransferase